MNSQNIDNDLQNALKLLNARERKSDVSKGESELKAANGNADLAHVFDITQFNPSMYQLTLLKIQKRKEAIEEKKKQEEQSKIETLDHDVKIKDVQGNAIDKVKEVSNKSALLLHHSKSVIQRRQSLLVGQVSFQNHQLLIPANIRKITVDLSQSQLNTT